MLRVIGLTDGFFSTACNVLVVSRLPDLLWRYSVVSDATALVGAA